MDVSDDEKLEDIDAKIGEKASKSLLPGETSKRKTGSKYLLIHENNLTKSTFLLMKKRICGFFIA